MKPSLDLGRQALTNRFLSSPEGEEARFEFSLGQCAACGIVQLINPVPAEELKPRVDWISYREAEGHLDQLVEQLVVLPDIKGDARVGAISSKDDSVLARLRGRGFSCWRIDICKDLQTEDDGAGPETIQRYLTHDRAASILEQKGAVDILIARHVVEHAQNPRGFISALRQLVKPGGYLIIEVPDCEPALRRLDYTMPWEEHVLYFTPQILKRAANIWGLGLVDFRVYPYLHENSLVMILRSDEAAASRISADNTAKVIALGERYARAFPGYRRRASDALATYRGTRGPIAMFGAGHLSATWINFLQVGDYIEFVVDDDPHKSGLYMPGSHLPILPSEELTRRGIRLCLTSLNQESEARVTAKNRAFVDRGGCFASIFPERENSFPTPCQAAAAI